MRVLIIPSWYETEDNPNNGIFFKEQANALIEAGIEVCIIYPDLRFKLKRLRRGLFKDFDADFPTYIYRKRTWTPGYERGRWPQISKMLEMLYQKAVSEVGEFDLVHLHSARLGSEVVKLCKEHSLPLVYTEHYSGFLKPMDADLKYQFETTLKGCDVPIAVSEDLKARMVYIRPDTLFIPNMVDTDQFKIMSNVNIKPGFVFASVGNLVSIKGYDMLIEAFAKAKDKIPGAVLNIAGSGEEEENLKKLITDLKLSDRVFLTGFLSRKLAPEFYNQCDCYVCSSNFETFGVSMIEALACGKPIIATRCGGPLSIVNHKNGMLINNGNVYAMQRALILMYRQAKNYYPYELREDCIKRFGKKYVCQRIVQLYAHVLNKKHVAAEKQQEIVDLKNKIETEIKEQTKQEVLTETIINQQSMIEVVTEPRKSSEQSSSSKIANYQIKKDNFTNTILNQRLNIEVISENKPNAKTEINKNTVNEQPKKEVLEKQGENKETKIEPSLKAKPINEDHPESPKNQINSTQNRPTVTKNNSNPTKENLATPKNNSNTTKDHSVSARERLNNKEHSAKTREERLKAARERSAQNKSKPEITKERGVSRRKTPDIDKARDESFISSEEPKKEVFAQSRMSRQSSYQGVSRLKPNNINELRRMKEDRQAKSVEDKPKTETNSKANEDTIFKTVKQRKENNN